jgi:hypothetical protein
MAFVAAPNIAMIEWRCTRNGQQIENRLMVNMLTTPNPTLLAGIAVQMWDWWENTHSAHLSDTINLREVVATDMSQQNGSQAVYAPDTTTVGLQTGAALPNEVAFCVSLRSGSRGRSARGRWYTLSVVQAQMVDDNFLTPTAAGEFVADINALLAIIEGDSYLPVIVSYRSGGIPRPGGPVYFPITNATAVDAGVDSQRRRKPGVGT